MRTKFVSDESGLTVTVETIILFAISIIFLMMIVQSFQGLNQKQTRIALEENFMTIGNSIAKKLSEMNLEAQSSLGAGSQTTLRSEIWLPAQIVGSTYTVKLSSNKVILESSGDPYVIVEVPINSDINIAENSKIYSSDYKYVLLYDSLSGSIFFQNGGVIPKPDFNAPSISIVSPDNGTTIDNTTAIIVDTWDDVGVTKVLYYVDQEYKYTAKNPYNWTWDTTTMSDGLYNVTAVAYDAAGHTTPDTKSYYILNGITYPPVVTVISPADGEITNFTKPDIKARISDNRGIDFSSISLFVDDVNKIANVTYVNVSQKLTTITYTPTQAMNISIHNISLHVKDIDPSPENVTNWSFTIEDLLPDADDPIASIDSPLTNASLVPGNPISVSYSASDIGSGLDNLSIEVTRNSTNRTYYNKTVSKYPDIITSYSAIWEFTDKYESGINYKYNITVFDRSGRKGFATTNTLMVPLIGQDTELEVVTTGKTLTSSNKILGNITMRDISPNDGVVITIKNITVSWITNSSSEKISRVKFNGGTYWRGNSSYTPNNNQQSGNKLTLKPPYTFTDGIARVLELTFVSSMAGKSFTIIFQLSDGTTKTVTLST